VPCSGLDHAAIKALKLRGVKVKLVDGNPASKKVLNSKAAGLQSAEAVVLCGLGQQPAGSADVQVRGAALSSSFEEMC
jgi:hypothetical protein